MMMLLSYYTSASTVLYRNALRRIFFSRTECRFYKHLSNIIHHSAPRVHANAKRWSAGYRCRDIRSHRWTPYEHVNSNKIINLVLLVLSSRLFVCLMPLYTVQRTLYCGGTQNVAQWNTCLIAPHQCCNPLIYRLFATFLRLEAIRIHFIRG